MTNHHPITPPPELVKQWEATAYYACPVPYTHHIARCAAQWGADQELEGCCKWLPKLPPWSAEDLRKHRRPNPPSLKKQALHDLEALEKDLKRNGMGFGAATIRRALEQL